MPELLEKLIRAKLGAEGSADPSADHIAGTEQMAKNFLAMVEAWFEHHFGVSAEEAAAKANQPVTPPDPVEAPPAADGDKA